MIANRGEYRDRVLRNKAVSPGRQQEEGAEALFLASSLGVPENSHTEIEPVLMRGCIWVTIAWFAGGLAAQKTQPKTLGKKK